jgi:hypothetical protein
LAVTLAVTVPERSGVRIPCEEDHKEVTMGAVIAGSPARTTTFRDRDTADQADLGHETRPSWLWTLVEALAYAGAAFDPAAALAAQRFARIRDEELRGRS